jgi:hypothetical protein
MRFARDKSLLLAVLAMIAPLALPFNEVVGWGSVVAFLLVVAIFLGRTLDGRETLLPYWVMNVLGVLYLPILFLDLTVLRQGRILQPLVHLAMFALVVKLYAMHREKDKWHVLLTVFFVFLASVGTSVHPSVFPFMLVFLGLGILVLTRFAGMFTVGEFRQHEVRLPRVPIRGFIAGTVVLVILGAAPLFFLMPRLRRPYVWAPTAGSGSSVQVSGFSDRMDLDVIGRVRTSRAVMLRFSHDSSVRFPTENRFKASVFDRFDEGTWKRSRRPTVSINRSPDGLFHLSRERIGAWMSVWQRTMGNSRLILPVETRSVDLAGNSLALSDSGVVMFMLPPPGTAEYRVAVGAGPLISGAPPSERGESLDLSGVSPEIRALAGEVISGDGPLARISSIERYLLENFNYTVDLGGQPTDRPVERFLFETREGHCEYFVSAMVLMLRSQGIPSRVVTGYLGADYNDWQKYFIVRQSHAHAWVEAWVDDVGWQMFDPTPASGRPSATSTGFGALLDQAWDAVLFRWDRYVLTYGFYDQVGAFIKLRELFEGLWGVLPGSGDSGNSAEESTSAAGQQSTPGETTIDWLQPRLVHVIPFVLMALAVAIWLWWRRERMTATVAYRQLRARLLRTVPEAGTSTPPLEVERLLMAHFPGAAPQARRVVELYLEERFGGRDLESHEIGDVREALRNQGRRWKKAG